MKQSVAVLLALVLLGCTHNSGSSTTPGKEKVQEYSSTAITLSDCSMKIMGYYQSQHLSVPEDFDARQFFDLLQKIYPDQPGVAFIQKNYKVSVRWINGGYSVMLCDPKTNQKIMEDFSCHVNRVEIQSWQSPTPGECVFEKDWKAKCD